MRAIALYGLDDNGHCTCHKGAECTHPGKHPIGSKDQWRSPEHGDNIGLVTGDGLLVLDIDVKGQSDGRESLAKLCEGRPLPDTYMVRTGSGGLHYYFSVPASLVIRNTVGKLGKSIDTRGTGGYVVGPPSRTPAGEYVALNDLARAEAPGWLLDLIMGDVSSDGPVVDESQIRTVLERTRHDDRYNRATRYAAKMDVAVEGQGGDLQTLKVAGVGHSFGVEQERWYTWMLAHYNDRCTPPWSKKDLQQKVDNAYQYNAGYAFGWRLAQETAPYFDVDALFGRQEPEVRLQTVLPSYADTDVVEGYLRITDRQWLNVNGAMMLYSGKEWRWVQSNDIKRALMADLNGALFEVDGQLKRFSIGYKTLADLERTLRVACESMTEEQFAEKILPRSVSFRDGVISLNEDGKASWHEHGPDTAGMQYLDFDLDPGSDIDCPTWFEALEGICRGEWEEEKKQLIGEFFGACMTGDGAASKKLLILYGQGNNGKSTVLLPLQDLLIAPGRSTAISLNNLNKEPHLVRLKNALANIVGEMPSDIIRHTAIIKDVVTGETRVEAAAKYEAPISFRPRAGHIMSANDLPPVDDASEGFWRRVIVLPLENDVTKFRVVPKTPEEWMEGFAAERASIAKWAIQCYAAKLARGHYTSVPSGEYMEHDWQIHSSPVTSFVDEMLVASDQPVPSRILYRVYREWCQQRGLEPLNLISLSRHLSKSFTRYRNNESRGFYVEVKQLGAEV